MNAPQFAERASRLLATAHSGDGPAPSEADRARAIAAIEEALVARRTRRSRQRVAFGALAVAAVMAAGVGVAALARHDQGRVAAPSPSPVARERGVVSVTGHANAIGATVEHDGKSAPFVDGVLVARGSRVVARSDGGVTLALSTGTKLSLAQGAELDLVSDGAAQVFALSAGSVHAEVAKLKGDERFLVRTADTEVEVRGTVFRVERTTPNPACGGGTATRVQVTEGVVVVRNGGTEDVLRAGDAWPRDCAAKTVAAVPEQAAPAMARAATERMPARATGAVGSRLEEQNDLFARAAAAKQAGRALEAADGFAEYSRRFPKGPLAENAAAERMRSLDGVDARRAASAARDYLSRFPRGFARAEAEAIAAKGGR